MFNLTDPQIFLTYFKEGMSQLACQAARRPKQKNGRKHTPILLLCAVVQCGRGFQQQEAELLLEARFL